MTNSEKTLALQYSVIDSFSSRPLFGNPAAVLVLPRSNYVDDELMQLVAREFNISETAFVYPLKDDGKEGEENKDKGTFGLRWFSPTTEVTICGHATLAAAAVLFRDFADSISSLIKFQTRFEAGILSALRLKDGRIELEFPSAQLTEVSLDEEGESFGGIVKSVFERALQLVARGGKVGYIGRGAEKPYHDFLLVEVEGDGLDLEALDVDTSAFLNIPKMKAIVVTQRSPTPNEHFISRVFGPALGIPEDPVTGSAHCVLGPYWSNKLKIPDGEEMIGKQVSKRRGIVGVVWEKERCVCKLRGEASLAAKGEMFVERSQA